MKEIAKRISYAEDLHKNKKLGDLIQRQVTNRSKVIAQYLLTQPQCFFNALIIGVYGGSPEWYELEIGQNELFDPANLPFDVTGALGILALDGQAKLFAIDGQHRVAGIKEAIKSNNKPRKFNDEEVSCIFISANVKKKDGLKRTRRLFSTLNRYAKPVDMMEIIALDEDDAVAIITRRLIEEHPLFQDHRLSTKKGKAIPVQLIDCFTNITALYEVNNTLLRNTTKKKWDEFRRFRPSEDKLIALYRDVIAFWNKMVDCFEPLKEVKNSKKGQGIAGRYRSREGGHLLFRTYGILAAATAIKKATEVDNLLSFWIDKMSRIPMELTSSPWVGLLWEPALNLMITRKENQNVATMLLLYMIGFDLENVGANEEDLRKRYASALNRPESEIQLPL